MDTESLLITCLAALVLILLALLLPRLIRERRHAAAMRGMNPTQFSEFLRLNSLNGGIQEVARKVSDLLKTSFGCERIMFLRLRHQFLELNYYHGIRGFDRQDLRLTCTRPLIQRLQEDFLPRDIARLRAEIGTEYYQKLTHHDVDAFFPVFWRDHLYGLYFVRSTVATKSPSFNLLIAGLAQSLSAAYHIKWHETRYDSLRKQLDAASTTSRQDAKTHDRLHGNMLKLVRHHDSRTLVPRLIDTIRRDLGISRAAYFYRDVGGAWTPQTFQTGLSGEVKTPDKGTFRAICRALDSNQKVRLEELDRADAVVREWARGLKAAGLKCAMSFPLSAERAGVLAWSEADMSGQTDRFLQALRPYVSHLVENTEAYERVEEMSYTDNLTGLANRRYFGKRLEEEISRAKRYRRTVALIFFDVDNLKPINDKYGHLAGDSVLKQLGQILRKNVRTIDIVARYGGDEFCIVMPEADASTCERFMNRLQAEVGNWRFSVDHAADPVSCTISQGGAIYPDHADTPEHLVHAADQALLRAKEKGDNTSLLYQPVDAASGAPG
ncbi:MAG TPA: GGDEF domain-containing protein [Candidatus Deferrimicrobium sp.]|nr:GGDEF domain-containing protein [Candidatus Deferrimicrobium sp.]